MKKKDDCSAQHSADSSLHPDRVCHLCTPFSPRVSVGMIRDDKTRVRDFVFSMKNTEEYGQDDKVVNGTVSGFRFVLFCFWKKFMLA